MKWLFYDKESEVRARVLLTYSQEPSNKDMYDGYIEVENLIEGEEQQGKLKETYCNPTTNEVWYEYTDKPLNPEDELEQLKQQLQTTQNDLGTALFESAIDKAKITDLEAFQGEMLMEIAMLKIGGI